MIDSIVTVRLTTLQPTLAVMIKRNQHTSDETDQNTAAMGLKSQRQKEARKEWWVLGTDRFSEKRGKVLQQTVQQKQVAHIASNTFSTK